MLFSRSKSKKTKTKKSSNEKTFSKADKKRKEAVSNAGRELQQGKSSGARVLLAHKSSLKK